MFFQFMSLLCFSFFLSTVSLAQDQVNLPASFNGPIIIVEPEEPQSAEDILAAQIRALEEENIPQAAPTEREKQETLAALDKFIQMKALFSRFHTRLFAIALENVNGEFYLNRPQDDLGQEVVGEMARLTESIAKDKIIVTGLESEEDLKVIDKIGSSDASRDQFSSLLTATHPFLVAILRRQLVFSGVAAAKMQFSPQEILEFSRLSDFELNQQARGASPRSDTQNPSQARGGVDGGNYLPVDTDPFLSLLFGGIISAFSSGAYMAGMVYIFEGMDEGVLLATLGGFVGFNSFLIGGVLQSSTYSPIMQKAGVFMAIPSLAIPAAYVTGIPNAELAAIGASGLITYSRSFLSRVFGAAKYGFSQINLSRLKILSGGKYSRLNRALTQEAHESLKVQISQQGLLEAPDSLEDLLSLIEQLEPQMDQQYETLLESIDISKPQMQETENFNGFYRVQREMWTYTKMETDYQFKLSITLSRALTSVTTAFEKWKSDPSSSNERLLFEEVFRIGDTLEQIKSRLQAGQMRSGKAKNALRGFGESWMKALEESRTDDAASLEAGVRDLIATARFGSSKYLYLTYNYFLQELDVLKNQRLHKLLEPVLLSGTNDSLTNLNLANLESDSRTEVLNAWRGFGGQSLFENFRPQTFLSTVLSSVNDDLIRLKPEHDRFLQSGTRGSCAAAAGGQ